MNGRRILGIDVGVNGACSVYCPDSIVPTIEGGLFDIPTIGEGKQREIDVPRMRDLVWAVRPDRVVIERINAFMPTGADGRQEAWGATSKLRFAGAFFTVKAVVRCLGIEPLLVEAWQWKWHFDLQGGDEFKDDARVLTLERWPSLQPFLNRKKDGHRADAFLIAAYGHARDEGTHRRGRRSTASKAAPPARRRALVDEEIPE